MALEATGILNQEADPGGTALVDARNGFNELGRLEIMWTVRYLWPVGGRFEFNCYKHHLQLLLRQTGNLPVTLLRQEGVTEGYPLSMFLYYITLVPLVEELWTAGPGILTPFMWKMYSSTDCYGGAPSS